MNNTQSNLTDATAAMLTAEELDGIAGGVIGIASTSTLPPSTCPFAPPNPGPYTLPKL